MSKLYNQFQDSFYNSEVIFEGRKEQLVAQGEECDECLTYGVAYHPCDGKSPTPEPKYKILNFTSVDDVNVSTISIQSNEYGFKPEKTPKLNYSFDGGETWTDYEFTKYTDEPNEDGRWVVGEKIDVPFGETVWFAGTNDGFAEGEYTYFSFVMTGLLDASGNITSILDGKGEDIDITAKRCFYYLFENCESLTLPPELPSKGLADNCYQGMFFGCTNLKKTPSLVNATTLKPYCYMSMFDGCSLLKDAPELPATKLSEGCYQQMFFGCTSLQTTPKLLADEMSVDCYNSMFAGCTSLDSVPNDMLRATKLATNCYQMMFKDCTGLIATPNLPAEQMADNCYEGMFQNCTSLKQAPSLKAAKKLASNCFERMFAGCESLEYVNTMPLEDVELVYECYQGMFYGCKSLVSAPELKNTKLAKHCYREMFDGCISLTNPPVLPALVLYDGCYQYMFYGCAFTESPLLPADTLVPNCYSHMFDSCLNLSKVTALFKTNPYDSGSDSYPYTNGWLEGVSQNGVFVYDGGADWINSYTPGTSTIPSEWITQQYVEP